MIKDKYGTIYENYDLKRTEDGTWGVWSKRSKKFLKPRHNGNVRNKRGNDHFQVVVSQNGVRRDVQIGELVLATLGELPSNPDEMTLEHIDGNCQNDELENLEWLTPQENSARGGRMAMFRKRRLGL